MACLAIECKKVHQIGLDAENAHYNILEYLKPTPSVALSPRQLPRFCGNSLKFVGPY